MNTSHEGRAALALHEGVRLTAYKDSVGILTIGVGHTAAAGPPEPTPGMTITKEECDAILARDLARFEDAVNRLVTVPLNQNEFDALVSLVFNIGEGAFKNSTVLRKLNAGDRKGAADAILMWDKAGGHVVKGLTNRRRAERELFLSAPSHTEAPPESADISDAVHMPAELEASLEARVEALERLRDRIYAQFPILRE